METYNEQKARENFHFNPETFAVKGAYASCMYGEKIPSARDSKTTAFVKNHLDFSKGDALILLGEFDKEVYLDCLKSVKEQLDSQEKLFKRFSQTALDPFYFSGF